MSADFKTGFFIMLGVLAALAAGGFIAAKFLD